MLILISMKNLFQLIFTTFFIVIFIFSKQVFSQSGGVARVSDEWNVPLNFAWSGGLDAAQYNELDMNLDGVMDLLVFDRRGNRKMCFINEGVEGEISYTYQPSYAQLLPDLFEWARLVDYDYDGKMDIFTYSPGYASMMVYHNISDAELKFQRVVYPYLTSLQGGGYVNIFVTSADYPGIVDVDNDGDLDILSFWGLGSFMEMHQNMSMEKYGVPDSLDFEQTTFCWGQFAESDESNVLYLDTCLNNTVVPRASEPRAERHTGSTLLFADLNNNGQHDLVLGDVDFPGLFALYNDGTNQLAHIGSIDTLFPSVNEPVLLYAMPVASLIDVNNDGLRDLLVGVFDPGLITSRNHQSSWLYLNVGSNQSPVFELETKAFLQEKMIDRGSGAYPVLSDVDGDGLTDLLIGNYGYYSYSYYQNSFLHSVYYARIGYYKNVGTAQNPSFQLWEEDFGKLGHLNLTGLMPTLGDLDGDGDADMLVGKADGQLLEVINEGDGNFTVASENYAGIDVGEYSAPQLFDLDKDGKPDLIVGERAGNLNYFKNVSSNEIPEFQHVTDSLGKVNVTDYNLSYDGYSTPCFFRKDNGETGLLSGSEQGEVFYFTNIDNNLDGRFELNANLAELIDTTDVNFDRGMRTAVAIAHMNHDDSWQLFLGNYSGGLELFNGIAGVTSPVAQVDEMSALTFKPNPASGQVRITGLENANSDMVISAISMEGRQLPLSYMVENHKTIVVDISRLKQGIYLLNVVRGNQRQWGKLVVWP